MFRIFKVMKDLILKDIYVFYALACFAHIIAGVVCACIRSVHYCPPFDQDKNYFYPARYYTIAFFLMPLFHLPYFLDPYDNNYFDFVLMFILLATPMTCSMQVYRHFMLVSFKNSPVWRQTIIYIVFFVIGLVFLCSIFGFDIHSHAVEFKVGSCVVWLIMCTKLAVEVRWIRKRIQNYHEQNFSNEDDYPYKFAEKILYSLYVGVALAVFVFLCNSRWVLAIYDLFQVVWCVIFLGLVLPARYKPAKKDRDGRVCESEGCEKNGCTDSDVIRNLVQEEEIEKKQISLTPEMVSVKEAVLEQVRKQYLNENLRRSDIIDGLTDVNKTLACAYIAKIGFYRLINAFRLRHLELYMKEHPRVTIEAAAVSSGFKDRYAYYNAKKRMKNFDWDEVSAFLVAEEEVAQMAE